MLLFSGLKAAGLSDKAEVSAKVFLGSPRFFPRDARCIPGDGSLGPRNQRIIRTL
jgi:hypothetical protein